MGGLWRLKNRGPTGAVESITQAGLGLGVSLAVTGGAGDRRGEDKGEAGR